MALWNNLIQDPDIQRRLQRGLSIKGTSSPAPTLSPEVVPVVLVKDLRDTEGREITRTFMIAAEAAPDVPNGWPAAVKFRNLNVGVPVSPVSIVIEQLVINSANGGLFYISCNLGDQSDGLINIGQIGQYRDTRIQAAGAIPSTAKPYINVAAGATQLTSQAGIQFRVTLTVPLVLPVQFRLEPGSYLKVEAAATSTTFLEASAIGYEIPATVHQ